MLVLGRSAMQVMPSVGSGRYSPGPGTKLLLEEMFYQEIRSTVGQCSLIRLGFLAIDSESSQYCGERDELSNLNQRPPLAPNRQESFDATRRAVCHADLLIGHDS